MTAIVSAMATASSVSWVTMMSVIPRDEAIDTTSLAEFSAKTSSEEAFV